ncbi:MAG: hypothetical protein IPK28_17335 [Devosia sp.]|nr:hypothetical protein [Devosia sp.]
MNSLVLYYSNTGNTQKVAQALAVELGADLAEVTCDQYLSMPGRLLMALDVFTRRKPRINVLVPHDAEYDLVVIGGPVWAARPAPPLVAALESVSFGRAALAHFVTCNGTSPKWPPERAIAEMESSSDMVPIATHIFREAGIGSGAYRAEAAGFAAELQAALSPAA